MPTAAAPMSSSNPDFVSITLSPRRLDVTPTSRSTTAPPAYVGPPRPPTPRDPTGRHRSAIRVPRTPRRTGYDGPGDHADRAADLSADRGAAPPARRRARRSPTSRSPPAPPRSTGPPSSRGTSRSCWRARHPRAAVPGEHGGLGADLLTICLAIEQISRACATTGLILAVQELGRAAAPARRHRRAAGALDPEAGVRRALIAFALTEAEAGSDAAADPDARRSATATTTSSRDRSGSSARDRSPTSSRSSPSPTPRRTAPPADVVLHRRGPDRRASA